MEGLCQPLKGTGGSTMSKWKDFVNLGKVQGAVQCPNGRTLSTFERYRGQYNVQVEGLCQPWKGTGGSTMSKMEGLCQPLKGTGGSTMSKWKDFVNLGKVQGAVQCPSGRTLSTLERYRAQYNVLMERLYQPLKGTGGSTMS